MKILSRYIGYHVAAGTVISLAALLALFTVVAFVDDLGDVGKGRYTVADAVGYMMMTMPLRAFNLFPLAALIGSMMGLGLLAGHSELTVIRGAGVSSWRITLAVMKAGALVMIFALFIGEVIAPYSERLAQEKRSVALTNQVGLRTAYGFWVRDGTSYINIRKILPDNEMQDVYIYEFDAERRLRVSTRAGSARYDDGNWVLGDITQSVIEEERIVRKTIDKAVWNSLFAPEIMNVVKVKPESLSAVGLHRYLAYLRDNGLSTSRYELALWAKIINPIATGVMIFLAIPLVLGRLNRVGAGQRLLVGILLGITFHIIQRTSIHMGIVYEFNPFMSAVLPTLVFAAIAYGLMRKLT